jgi:hypothetical protein
LQALSGLGGIGKTHIAAKFAYRFRANYQAVLWARAETREDLIASFVSIAHLLNLSGKDVQNESIPLAEIKRCLETQDNWLLILDNAQYYRTLYRTCRAALLKKRDGLVEDHPELVVTTWPLSFEKTEQAKPAVADLLQVCAFLSPDTISEEIFTQGAAHLGSRLEPVQVEEGVSIWREVGG